MTFARGKVGMANSQTDKERVLAGAGPELLIGLALGANAAWVNMAFKSLTLYGSISSTGNSEPVLDAVYLVSIVTVCLMLVIAAVAEHRTWVILAHFPTFVALSLGLAVTTIFLPLGDPAGTELHQVILLVTGVLSGIFSGLFLLYFGMIFAQLTTRGQVIAAATSTIFCSVLFVLFNVTAGAWAIPVAAAMPIASALLLLAGTRRVPLEESASAAEGASPENGFPLPFATAIQRSKPAPTESTPEKHAWWNLVWRIAVASALVGFANEAVRTIYMQMDMVNAGQYAYAGVQAIDSLIATVLVVALALVLLVRRTQQMAKDCYFVICFALILGVVFLPAPFVYERLDSFIPLAINSAAYSVFGMFVWILSGCICASRPSATISAFAAIRAAWALGPLVGIVVARTLLSSFGLSPQTTYAISLLALISVVLVATFVFSEGDLARIMAIIPAQVQQRFRFKCERVAKRYGLTERESEILVLLAKGRNLPYIQEKLYLSKSTVSTHRQHIYEKTGVHSQQELINLVQEAE